MTRENQSSMSKFLLLGLPIRPEQQGVFFALFLGVYLTTVLGNLLILLLIGVVLVLWGIWKEIANSKLSNSKYGGIWPAGIGVVLVVLQHHHAAEGRNRGKEQRDRGGPEHLDQHAEDGDRDKDRRGFALDLRERPDVQREEPEQRNAKGQRGRVQYA